LPENIKKLDSLTNYVYLITIKAKPYVLKIWNNETENIFLNWKDKAENLIK